MRKALITVGFRFKCACTSSGGVKAIHWFSETSAKRGLLNISRKRNGVSHRLIDPTPIGTFVAGARLATAR
jgi:hypothetical protein